MSRGRAAAADAPAAEEVPDLGALAAAEQACTRCELYREATQAVPGEGPPCARLMLVGEQPGDREDIEGHPFVGPAGRLLHRALADAGIDPADAYVTNAVKHFKHQPRGKRRLHKRPNAYEIDRCRWWIDIERRLVRPQVVVALGATAARSLLGRAVTIAAVRGRVIELGDGSRLVITVHPSSLLRIREEQDRAARYRDFVDDLKASAGLLAGR